MLRSRRDSKIDYNEERPPGFNLNVGKKKMTEFYKFLFKSRATPSKEIGDASEGEQPDRSQ